jgi:copper chaperone
MLFQIHDEPIFTCVIYKYITMSQKIERISFRIIGMYCITCKPIVERQLKDEKAMQRIDIDYMTKCIIVEFNSSLINREEIKNSAFM